MKIAIIDPVGIKAGMNCYDLGLLNALRQDGIDAFSFSNFNDDRYPRVKQYPFFLNEKKGVLENTTNFISAHFKALAICKKENVEWVILHVFSTTPKDLFSFYGAKLFGRKIIAIIHDVSSLSNEDNAFIRNKMYSLAHILVVHNTTSYKEISGVINTKDKEKLRIIPHGNYVDFVNNENEVNYFRNVISFDPAYKYLLFFGQIKKVKGLEVLLRAVPLLSQDYKIIIAGRPHRDDFAYYENIINELNIADRVIKIIRFITDDERDYLFKRCDALILPYRKIFQSGVLLLAMSYGLPVIASDLPANKEVIVDGENGILFKDGDYADLADRIKPLFLNENIDKIRTKTLETAKEKYSWKLIAKLYKQLLF